VPQIGVTGSAIVGVMYALTVGSKPAMADGEDGLSQHATSADDQRKGARFFAAVGTAALAISAESGIAFVAHGHAEAAMVLISSSVIGVATIVAAAVVQIYDSAQRTRRLLIQHVGPSAIARAMASCIDAAHLQASDALAWQHTAEAASVRANARQIVTDMMPAMLAAIGHEATVAPDHRVHRLPDDVAGSHEVLGKNTLSPGSND
jgi:hypothetical protein